MLTASCGANFLLAVPNGVDGMMCRIGGRAGGASKGRRLGLPEPGAVAVAVVVVLVPVVVVAAAAAAAAVVVVV